VNDAPGIVPDPSPRDTRGSTSTSVGVRISNRKCAKQIRDHEQLAAEVFVHLMRMDRMPYGSLGQYLLLQSISPHH
jgi:hypothetical protein